MRCGGFAAERSPSSPCRRGDEEPRSLIAANLTARLLRAVASTIISLCVAAAASADDNSVPAAISREELIATAVAGIEHNDELLGMVQAEIEDEALQPGVPETKRFTHKSPNGAVLEYTMTPRAIVQRRFIVHGANVRQEHIESGQVSQYFVVRQDRSIQYVTGSKITWIRRPGDLGAGYAIDPREIGNMDQNRTLTTILREDTVTTAELVKGASGAPLASFIVRGPKSQKFLWELDPARNFLPVRCVLYHPDGTYMNVVTQIKYQQLPGRSAWFLREAVQHVYGPGKTKESGAPGWIVQTTSRVTKVVTLDALQNQSAFELRIPDGVEIRDNFTGQHYVLGQEGPGTLGPWTRTFMIGLAALVVCGIVAVSVRFIRSR